VQAVEVVAFKVLRQLRGLADAGDQHDLPGRKALLHERELDGLEKAEVAAMRAPGRSWAGEILQGGHGCSFCSAEGPVEWRTRSVRKRGRPTDLLFCGGACRVADAKRPQTRQAHRQTGQPRSGSYGAVTRQAPPAETALGGNGADGAASPFAKATGDRQVRALQPETEQTARHRSAPYSRFRISSTIPAGLKGRPS